MNYQLQHQVGGESLFFEVNPRGRLEPRQIDNLVNEYTGHITLKHKLPITLITAFAALTA